MYTMQSIFRITQKDLNLMFSKNAMAIPDNKGEAR
jgi:hypothetical protein